MGGESADRRTCKFALIHDAVTLGAVTRSAPELAPSRRPRQVGRARWPATRTTRLLGSALLLCLVWAAMPTQQLSATATATGRLHSVLTRTSLGLRTVRVGYAHQWHRAACYQGPTHGTYHRTRIPASGVPWHRRLHFPRFALKSIAPEPAAAPVWSVRHWTDASLGNHRARLRLPGQRAEGWHRAAWPHGQSGLYGSATARPLRLLRVRRSALTLTALPWQTAALRHPSPPRVLALAASKVTNPTTLCHPGLGRSGVATAGHRGGGAAAAAARARHRPPRD